MNVNVNLNVEDDYTAVITGAACMPTALVSRLSYGLNIEH